jgi:hypothetical protein
MEMDIFNSSNNWVSFLNTQALKNKKGFFRKKEREEKEVLCKLSCKLSAD